MIGTTDRATFDDLLSSAAMIEDPYPIYARVRESAPVYRCEPRNEWLITGYDEVMAALHAPEDFSNVGWELSRFLALPEEVRQRCAPLEQMLRTPAVVFSDPPTHTRLRKQVNRSFTPRAIESSREWLTALCKQLFDEMAAASSVDIVRDLANPLPIRAIVGLFGGDPEDVPLYKKVSSTRMLFQGTPRPDIDVTLRLNGLLIEFRQYLEELWTRLEAEPDSGLLSSLLMTDESGDRLTDDELFHACVVFLSAGHETTTSLLANTVLALLRYPEQFELVCSDPTKVRAAVEEALRWITPVQRIHRIAARDVEFGGQRIREGELVVLALAAANRDPTRFADPDRFFVDRESAGQAAFGHGIHFCVGTGLARAEATIALHELLQRFESLSFDDTSPPRWAGSLNLRALESLCVKPRWAVSSRP